MTVSDPDSRKGIAATLIGWGASNTITPKLKETSVKIFSQKYCNYTREGQRRPRNLQNLFQDELLCAGKFTKYLLQRSWFLMFTVYKVVVVTRSNSFKCEF